MPRGEENSETAALVGSSEGISNYTEGNSTMLSPREGVRELQDNIENQDDLVASDVSVLSQFHQDAIRQAGFGYFQLMLMAAAGLGLAADTIELFVIAYILPSAELELCIDDEEKRWLGAITFMGIMIGGVVWGNLADRMGRRRTLLSALTVNAVFSVIAAFMPTFGTFMTARFCSAVGIGGSFPVVFAYFSEFSCKADRARSVSWLMTFWAFGGVYVCLTAWAILPRTGEEVVQDDKEHFSSWHQFLLICCLPCIAAIIGLNFLPESPRYLLEAGREVEAMMVYQRVFKVNNMHKPNVHNQNQLSELELPSKRPGRGCSSPPSPGKSVLADMTYSLETFWNSFLQLFFRPHAKTTFVFVVIWFTVAFSFYGLTVWFPEYIKQIKRDEYNSKATKLVDEVYNSTIFNKTIENVNWSRSHFIDCRFHHLVFNHVTFENCTFDNVEFANIKSSRTYFRNSNVSHSKFIDTDFNENRFVSCDLINNTFLSVETDCSLDIDYNIHLEEIYEENMVGHLSIVPAAFLTSPLVNNIGRVKLIGVSLFLCTVASLFIWFLETAISVLIFEAIFKVFWSCSWIAINIVTIECFPTHLRTTGYGFLSATCRLGGVLGMTAYAGFLKESRLISMLTTGLTLLIAGLMSVQLTDTSQVLL